jgi:ABC-type multidrug transport system permease subunit
MELEQPMMVMMIDLLCVLVATVVVAAVVIFRTFPIWKVFMSHSVPSSHQTSGFYFPASGSSCRGYFLFFHQSRPSKGMK